MSATRTDPRRAELQLLADLDRQASVTLSPSEDPAKYGFSRQEFRDLVFGLLCDGCLGGRDPLVFRDRSVYTDTDQHPQDPRTLLWRTQERIFPLLRDDQSFTVVITHAGRLRLWRLRDEMNRSRVLERFGILVDGRHFDDDLRTQFWMMKDGAPVSVMMADLDHFKEVNDKCGHARGDEALRLYLSIVRKVASSFNGEAYRDGGDETLTILPGLEVGGAVSAAEVLRQAVEAEFREFDSRLVRMPTSSIGVATFTHPDAPTAVRKRVDISLYKAKERGRNRVERG